MTLPVDPTIEDLSPRDMLLDLPTDAACDRALAAADVGRTLDSADTGTSRQHVAEELSVVDRRRVAAQVRFAAPRTMHYYRLPDLPSVDAADLEDPAGDRSSGGFGAQVRAVSEAHDRAYAVCSVPAGGTQAQLSVSEALRVRTVAAFDPGTTLLAVRADTPETAAGTVDALSDHPAAGSSERIRFTDERFLGGSRTNASKRTRSWVSRRHGRTHEPPESNSPRREGVPRRAAISGRTGSFATSWNEAIPNGRAQSYGSPSPV